jgi:hypothetical protein
MLLTYFRPLRWTVGLRERVIFCVAGFMVHFTQRIFFNLPPYEQALSRTDCVGNKFSTSLGGGAQCPMTQTAVLVSVSCRQVRGEKNTTGRNQCEAGSNSPEMEAKCSPETLIDFQRNKRSYIPVNLFITTGVKTSNPAWNTALRMWHVSHKLEEFEIDGE